MSMRRRARMRAYAIPLLLAFALYLPGAWQRSWQWDPALYAAVSIRAARTGEWWTLHHANVTYFNKPPLWFWIHGAFVKVFGTSDFFLHLPDLLAALMCVAITVSLAMRLHGPRVALVAGILLAACTEYMRRISQFRLDLPHAALMLMAVRLIVAGCLPMPRPSPRTDNAAPARTIRPAWIIASGVPIGLALLIKPIFALLALALAALWMALAGARARRALPWIPAAAGVAILVAAPWHLSMAAIHGEAFWEAYFLRQSVARATGKHFGADPWYAYFAFLSGIEFPAARMLGGRKVSPWCVPMVAAAALAMLWWLLGRRLAPRRAKTGGLLVQVWTLGLLAALSAFGDKKSWYLAPVWPGVAWMGSLWITRLTPRAALRLLWRSGPWLALGVLALVLIQRPSFDRPMGAPPEMPAIERFVTDNPRRDYWNGSLHHYDNARLYLRTGVWPKFGKDDNTGEVFDVPVGAVLLHDTRRGRPDPTDRILVTDGRFLLVERTSPDAARPRANTMPTR